MFGNTFKSVKKQRPPLWVWAAVGTIAAGLFLLLGSLQLPTDRPFRNAHELRYATYKARLKNLGNELVHHPDTQLVIIFGSSLTAQGVMRDSFFNKRFRRAGKPVKVHRIFYAGAFYEMLEDSDLITFLEQVQPDLLCIEDQAFLYNPLKGLRWTETGLTRLHKRYVYNINTIKHLLLPNVFTQPAGLLNTVDPTGTFDVVYSQADSVISHQDSTHYQVEMRSVRKMKETGRFNALAERLRRKGTEIVLIELPRPAKVRKAYLPYWAIDQRDRLLEQYAEAIDLKYWPFPRAMPFRYYWDISHLNKFGQDIYSEWLLEQLDRHFIADQNRSD